MKSWLIMQQTHKKWSYNHCLLHLSPSEYGIDLADMLQAERTPIKKRTDEGASLLSQNIPPSMRGKVKSFPCLESQAGRAQGR